MGKYSDEMALSKSIYLTGQGNDFQVHHDISGEAIVCHVPSADIGHTVVRALRQRQRDATAGRRTAASYERTEHG